MLKGGSTHELPTVVRQPVGNIGELDKTTPVDRR
jgi:hypothetical protein